MLLPLENTFANVCKRISIVKKLADESGQAITEVASAFAEGFNEVELSLNTIGDAIETNANNINTITTNLNSLSATVATLSTTVENLNTTVTNLTERITTLESQVQALTNVAMTNDSDGDLCPPDTIVEEE